nr:LysR family transcriptional regulator [uncultured Cohaesibacter sp.]
MPTLKQLHAFVAIARYGNLGDAAKSIHLSKGAVSQALAELELRLGTRVFDRVHPRLRLNDQGRQLQVLAEDILDRVEDIRHMFDHGGAPVGSLRIGASQTIGNYLLPCLLADIAGLDAKVCIANSQQLSEQLIRFELDLALIEGRTDHPDLVTRHWRRDEMLLVARPDHPLAGRQGLELSDLSGYNWVLREPKSGTRDQFDRDIAPYLAPMGKMLELNSIEALILAVEQGLGVSLVSRLAVAPRLEQKRLVSLETSQRFTRTLKFVWHRQKYHSALMDHFIASIVADDAKGNPRDI